MNDEILKQMKSQKQVVMNDFKALILCHNMS